MELKFIRTKPVGSIKTAKGLLFLYPDLRPDDFFNVGNGIEELNPKNYIQTLFRHLCHYDEDLPKDKSMPLKPSLSKDDINLLTDEELNKLASIYLENHTHDDSDVKKGDETDIKYIHRLAISQKKRLQEVSDAAMAKYAGLSTISDEVTEQINDSLLAAEALQNSTYHMDDIGLLARKHKSLPTLASPVPNISLEIKRELERLVSVTSQSSDFAIKSHQVQLSINNAIVTSGRETSSLARIGIGLTVVVIVISILSIIFIDSNSQEGLNEKANLLVNKLDLINESINKTTTETKNVSFALQKQNEKIISLSEKNLLQEKTIKRLKARLKALEKAAKHETVPVK